MNHAEVVLRYESQTWRAQGAGIDVAHAELGAIDAAIDAALCPRAAPLHVHVRFDMSSLPAWLRQYQAHYCNYSLLLSSRVAAP
jgi:hypothetical protein